MSASLLKAGSLLAIMYTSSCSEIAHATTEALLKIFSHIHLHYILYCTGVAGAKGVHGDKGDRGIPGTCSRNALESVTVSVTSTDLVTSDSTNMGSVRSVLDKLFGTCVEDFITNSGRTLSSREFLKVKKINCALHCNKNSLGIPCSYIHHDYGKALCLLFYNIMMLLQSLWLKERRGKKAKLECPSKGNLDCQEGQVQ